MMLRPEGTSHNKDVKAHMVSNPYAWGVDPFQNSSRIATSHLTFYTVTHFSWNKTCPKKSWCYSMLKFSLKEQQTTFVVQNTQSLTCCFVYLDWNHWTFSIWEQWTSVRDQIRWRQVESSRVQFCPTKSKKRSTCLKFTKMCWELGGGVLVCGVWWVKIDKSWKCPLEQSSPATCTPPPSRPPPPCHRLSFTRLLTRV